MLNKKDLEQRETEFLASFAVLSRESRGRVYAESPPEHRTEFQRDRDRVIHCRAFRRLKHKTQVFVATQDGDHYRTRLTHTLEVVQISRDIARTLGLNEDLTETIALAHDLGHTPFGHTGEKVLNELLKNYGGFEHNRQSKKIVECLEKRYADFSGLNLSYEVIDGLIKHRSPYDNSGIAPEQAPSLEAQAANLADEVAYNSHDIDDALAAGLLALSDLQSVRLWAEITAKNKKENICLADKDLINLNVRALINIMITDILTETEKRLRQFNIKNLGDVYAAPNELVGFSPELVPQIRELRACLYQKFYQHRQIAAHNKEAEKVLKKLFDFFVENPEKIQGLSALSQPEEVSIGDYIAGMTDQYAMRMYQQISG